MGESGKILLTGATGFIGSHILEALTAAGLPVAALVRSPPGAPSLGAPASLPASRNAEHSNTAPRLACSAGFQTCYVADFQVSHAQRIPKIAALETRDTVPIRHHDATKQVELRQGDIRDLPRLTEAVRGCAQVIHAAARASDWGPRREFMKTNVQGTLNVLEACRRQGVAHVILLGSISSYGEEDSREVKDESSPFRSHYPYFADRIFPSGYNAYRDSKALATQAAMDFARGHKLNVTILEPVWTFGEREFGTGFYAYVKAVRDGQRFMPGSRRNLFHVIYAPDLARACLLAAQRKLPGVERIIVGNPAAEPMHRIFGLFCTEAGLPAPRLLPKCSVYPAGLGLELLYTLARRPHPPLLTRGRVNMFYDSIQFSTGKARRLLGFECRYTLEEGIRRTVAWYKQNHFL